MMSTNVVIVPREEPVKILKIWRMEGAELKKRTAQ